ncbi:hypothetical protein RHMOL_Rhmol07G0216500 [Rhododendron molle]|uniref:Uncharacterized protein n=1 Tax=Rhododendron molle TaxID=49168 RepID=A0ACC0N307_RHOML|nr:hypothetical protein RHMOL_Rhmol07G0216500 [Rhododendron molle]
MIVMSLMIIARQESVRMQYEHEERQRFQNRTGGRYHVGGSSGAGGSGNHDIGPPPGFSRRCSSVRETNTKKQWSSLTTPEARLAEIEVDLHRSKGQKQSKMSSQFLKAIKQKLGRAARAVSQFVLYTWLPSNTVNSPWLEPMLDVAKEVGKGTKLPSSYEVAEVYLPKEYEAIQKWIGLCVSIMCDGWSGPRRRHLVNFLVYSNRGIVFHKSIDATDVLSRTADYYFGLMDKVVEEIGEQYIVQIITDNEAAMKAASKKLMEKRPHLYWTACAAHCIDLILEDTGEKKNVKATKKVARFIYNYDWVVDYMKNYTDGRDLLRPVITRFATNFITLESLVRYKIGLKNMFNSTEWKATRYARMEGAKEVRDILESKDFWAKAADILKVQEPLVKVLRLVDGDRKPTMGFIYEAMDRAKMAIQNNCRYYTEYWRIIDRRWAIQLHTDLHAAGYFLNSIFQYGGNLSNHREVMDGVRKVIMRLLPDLNEQVEAINQIRHATRRSDEERDDHFNPINLDYIFDEDDPLVEWLQEEEHAILDDVDNSEWLDTGDMQNPQNVDLSKNNSSGGRGLSPSGSGSEDDDGPNGGETQDNIVNRTTYHEEDGGIRHSTQQRRHSVSSGDGGSNRIRRSRPINDIYTDHNLRDQFGQLEVGQDHGRAHHWQQRPIYPYYPPQELQSYFNQPEPPFMGIGYPHRSHQHSYSGSSSYGSNPTVREPSTHGYSEQQSDNSGTTNNFEHCNFTNNFYGYLFGTAGQNSHGDDQFNEEYVDPPVPPRHILALKLY